MRFAVVAAVCGLVLGAGVTGAQAQTVTGGVKAGLTRASATASGLTSFETEATNGLAAGVFVGGGNDRVRIHAEGLYVTRRFRSTGLSSGSSNVKASGFEVPVLVSARFRQSSQAHPFLTAGPYLGFISKVEQTFASTTQDLTDLLASRDFGVVVGGGLDIDAPHGGFIVEARYTLGLKDLTKADDSTLKNRALMVLAGYRF